MHDHEHLVHDGPGGDRWYSAGAGMILTLVVAVLLVALIIGLVVAAPWDDDGDGLPADEGGGIGVEIDTGDGGAEGEAAP
jgi:hypothetical protein